MITPGRLTQRACLAWRWRCVRHALSLSGLLEVVEWARNNCPGQFDDNAKYFDVDFQLYRNTAFAIRLGLHKGRSQRILDLGAGCGWFCVVARYFGHEVTAVDVEHELYTRCMSHWNIPQFVHRIRARTPLPHFGSQFDLVVGLSVCFNGHEHGPLWGVPEWHFFFEDLAQQTTPTARLFMTINAQSDGSYLPEPVARYVADRGASISGRYVNLPLHGPDHGRSVATTMTESPP